jgi:hypothetical protein
MLRFAQHDRFYIRLQLGMSYSNKRTVRFDEFFVTILQQFLRQMATPFHWLAAIPPTLDLRYQRRTLTAFAGNGGKLCCRV